MTKDEWIKKAKSIHGDKYDYSKVDYKGCYEKVLIICPIHGEFWQKAYSHLNGRGCKKCSYIKRNFGKTMSKETFIEKSNMVHKNKYDYSKVEYKGTNKKVLIICPIHGEFWQKASNHLSGHGCPKCGEIEKSNKKRKTTEEFIKKSIKIHGNKYDYSKTNYIGVYKPVEIICEKHGSFLQRPNDHLNGHGCPSCVNSDLENKLRKELYLNGIEFEEYKKFKWLINENTNYPYSIDFYLPKYNIAIECQGIQHFKPVKFFGGLENLKYNIIKDTDKKRLCTKNGIKLIYFLDEKYNSFLNVEDIKFNNTKNLIEYILNYE